MKWMLPAALLFAGCFPRHGPIHRAAKAERKGQPDAEAKWMAALNEPLSTTEWRTAYKHVCALRDARITEAIATASPADFDVDQIREWRSELAHCRGTNETRAKLVWLQDGAALAALDAIEPTPDHAEIYSAYPHARSLSPTAERRTEYRAWRADWVAHLQSLEPAGPATRAWVDTLLSEAGEGPGADEASVQAALSVVPGTTTTSGIDTCASHYPLDTRTSEATGAVRVNTTFELSGCATEESQRMVDVAYEVKKFRTEMQEQTRTRQVPVQVPMTVSSGAQRCYQTSETHQTCFQDTVTKYITTYESESYTVTVPVQVPYFETEYRKELRHRRTAQASLTLTTETPFGTREQVFKLQHTIDDPSPVPVSRVFRELLGNARQDALERSVKAGLGAYLDALVSGADLSTAEGVEDRLLALAGGRDASAEERTAMARTLSLPVAALQTVRVRPADIDPVPLERDPAASPRAPDMDWVVEFGFPALASSIGGGRGTGPDTLEAHPTARSYRFTFRSDYAYPLVFRTPVGQVGLHVGANLAIHYGWRSQAKYEFPTFALGSTENEREPRSSVMLEGGAQVLAGTRNGLFALFVGVYPRAFGTQTGFMRAGGGSIPLAARFEVRPVPRRPAILTAWAYNVVDAKEPLETYGAHVMWPIAKGAWLTAEHSQQQAGTAVRGLHDADVIDAGRQKHQQTWAGILFGF